MRFIRFFRHDLPIETKLWVERGIITQEQAGKVLQHYGLSADGTSEGSFGNSVLNSIGAFFIGMALLLLIGRNWEEIPREYRIIAMIAVTLGLNYVGIRAWAARKFSRANLFLFFGALAYGGSLFLVGQIFHLSQDVSTLLLLWALGIAPIAYATKAVRFALLLSLVSIIYMVMEGSEGAIPWAYVLLSALLCTLLFRAVESRLVFAAQVVGLFVFIGFAFPDLGAATPVLYAYTAGSLGLLLFLSSLLLERYARSESHKDYALLLRIWLLRGILVVMFVMSFSTPWSPVIAALAENARAVAIIFIVTLVVGVAAIIARIRSMNRGEALSFVDVPIGIFYLIASWSALSFSGEIGMDVALVRHKSFFYHVLAANLLILASGLTLIVEGIRQRLRSPIIVGAIVLLILGFVRYIDLINDYVGASVLFIVEGVILIACARGTRTMKRTKEA